MKRIIKIIGALFTAAIVVYASYAAATYKGPVITQKDIDNNSGSLVAYYDETGQLYSLNGNLKNRKIKNEQDALKTISAYKDLFYLPENSEYKCMNIQESIAGTSYMFVQTVQGYEVTGSYISLVADNNILSSITVEVDRDIDSIASRRLTEKELNEIVVKECGDKKKIYSTKEIILNGRLTYFLYVVNSENIFAFDDIKLFVDAETKEVKTERELGSTLYATILYNEDKNIQVVDMREDNSWPLKMVELNGNLFPENIADTSDELGAAAYKNLTTTYDWYKTKFGRVSYDNKGGEILCLVGIDTLKDNAAYWQSLNVFIVGEAQRYDKAPGMFLDTMAHEYTHAVFKSIVGESIVRNGETEGISEAYADIFACLIDENWIMAEGIVEGKALTVHDNSSVETVTKKTYPVKYKDAQWSKTDGHINGVILTRIAYQMTQNGFANEEIADIWYQSMFYGYGDNSTYLTVKHNVEKAARALGYSNEKIKIISELFQAVGIE